MIGGRGVGARVGEAVVGDCVDGETVGVGVGANVGAKLNCRFFAAISNAVKFKTPSPVTGSLQTSRHQIISISHTNEQDGLPSSRGIESLRATSGGTGGTEIIS